jgi:SAM-dependent methyltransferase
MHPEAMKPYGFALSDYDKGNLSATLIIYRDDGWREELLMSTFFRQPQEYELERTALDLCFGHVLDVGAGTGIHTLFLQERGVPVCAIDVSPEAVLIMRQRGVFDVRQADILSFEDGEFDTVIMMGHGIGVVENIRGLVSFLEHVPGLLKANGQVLLTSLDVRVTNNPTHLEYQKRNLHSGRYFGEIRMQFDYSSIRGPLFGWLHIDAETLSSYASKTGWNCEVVQQQPDGNYLARLTRRHSQ